MNYTIIIFVVLFLKIGVFAFQFQRGINRVCHFTKKLDNHEIFNMLMSSSDEIVEANNKVTKTTTISSIPTTFIECARTAATAARLAIDNGETLLEVEFPPLPLEYLEDSSSSARDIADANSRWAIEFAKKFTDIGKVSIIYPDQPELDDAIKYVDMNGDNPFPNIYLATTRTDSIKNAKTVDQIITSIFGATIGGTVEAIPDTKLYIILVSSTQELPDIEKLYKLDPSIPIILFNLKLDFLVGA